jgi:hypothetical protein
MLVFSYGSNLCLDQWRRRCPSAALLGTGFVKGMALTFKGFSKGWGGATATIEPTKDTTVLGAVYELRDPLDVARLDRCEGYPTIYGCVEVVVRVWINKERTKTRKVKAWTYVREGEHGWPSNDYAGRIANGLKQHGLATEHLAKALAKLPAGCRQPVKPLPAPPPPPRQSPYVAGTWASLYARPLVKPAPTTRLYEDDMPPLPDWASATPAGQAWTLCEERGCDTEIAWDCAACRKAHCVNCCPNRW